MRGMTRKNEKNCALEDWTAVLDRGYEALLGERCGSRSGLGLLVGRMLVGP